MSSIVIELQQNALDSSVRVSDLLRKALVVAKKLGIADFEKWAISELDGYKVLESIPDYRIFDCTLEVWNPFHGWQPVLFESNDMQNLYAKRPSFQPISEFEELLDSGKAKKIDFLIMNFPAEIEKELMESIGAPTPPVLHVPLSRIIGMIDRIRNITLNWSLKLESDGILGDGLTFSEKEKQIATHNVWNVNNFYSAVNNSQFQQNPSNSPITVNQLADDVIDFIERMRSSISKLNFDKPEEAKIEQELDKLEKQVETKEPNTKKIKSGLQVIGRILEGAVGNAVGAGLYSAVT